MPHPHRKSLIAKLVAIPCLVAILAGVLYSNSRPKLDEANNSESAGQTSVRRPDSKTLTPIETKLPKPVESAVPDVPLAEVLASNPFGLSIEAASASTGATLQAITAEQEPAAALPTQLVDNSGVPGEQPQAPIVKVSAVLQSRGKRKSALIEGRIVHEGELIDESWRLIAIRDFELVVERAK